MVTHLKSTVSLVGSADDEDQKQVQQSGAHQHGKHRHVVLDILHAQPHLLQVNGVRRHEHLRGEERQVVADTDHAASIPR